MRVEPWKANGLVEQAWQRLAAQRGVSDGRDELSRATGIPGTNLSSLNTGKRAMTVTLAERIADAVRGLTILDLGAPAEAVAGPKSVLRVIDRLRSLEDEHAALRRQFDAFAEATTARLAVLEAAPAKRAQR